MQFTKKTKKNMHNINVKISLFICSIVHYMVKSNVFVAINSGKNNA